MKKILFFIFLSFLSLSLSAESAVLKFFYNDGEILEKKVNKNSHLLILSETSIPKTNDSGEFLLEDIEGLEQLENLQVIQINDVNFIDDFSFLSNLKYLKELYINSCFIKSIKFLENMQNLEVIDLTLYIPSESSEKFKKEIIDIDKLLFIKKIDFHVSVVVDEENFEDYNDIPKFINVKNQPVLNIGKNNLRTISENQISFLKQYSQIFLWPNPIISNMTELKKIDDLNIVLK